jgi:glycosyltransferase involved in cell wall biosynthesis
MSSLKYLFSLEELFPPFRVDTTELFANELYSRHNHQIRWIFLAEDEHVNSGEVEWAGGQGYVVQNIAGDSLFSKIFRQIKKMFVDLRYFKEALSNEWDFIQTRDRFFGGVLSVIASRIRGVRFFFWLSFPFPEMYEIRARDGLSTYPLLDKVRGHVTAFYLYKIIAKYADHVFVQSDQMKRDLIEKGVDAEKMTPVPMGISSSEIHDFISKTPRDPINKRLVYLGTLAVDRKLDFLVRVTRIVIDELGDIEMLFVGDGDAISDRDVILNEAKHLQIENNVYITGKLPREEAWGYVRNAAVCLSPFYPNEVLNSTSPTKLVEYMALGSPVVANNHPEQSKLINESGAGFCVDWDEKKFADAIIKIVTNKDLSARMSEKGEKYAVEKRDYRVIAESLDQKYRELCSL